jgi:hypothetical protein
MKRWNIGVIELLGKRSFKDFLKYIKIIKESLVFNILEERQE